jgi:rhodanese-related sulfurtransferase
MSRTPSQKSAISAHLDECRRHLDRVLPRDLPAEVAQGALIVDVRPREQRKRDGGLPGALVIDRNVLEWRLDPTSPHRAPEAADPDRRIILVCNEGYSSSLAARTLQQLGIARATDLVGGFQAWLAAGKPSGDQPMLGATRAVGLDAEDEVRAPLVDRVTPQRWHSPL